MSRGKWTGVCGGGGMEWCGCSVILWQGALLHHSALLTTHLEGHGVRELIEEHEQLTGADGKVRLAELVGHVPPQRPKLETLLWQGQKQQHRAAKG